MCLWLLRTTQSLLRLVSRPLLIVQQTTQHRDESRAGSVSTNAQTTFNRRNPGQISRLSKKKLRSRSKSERLLPPKHGPLACKWRTVPFNNARHSIFTRRVIYWLSISAFFMPIQECSIHKECRRNTQKGFYVRST